MSEPDVNFLPSFFQEAFAAVGFADTGVAARRLRELAGRGVTDEDLDRLIPLLLNALKDNPDPDRALTSFTRWFEALNSPTLYLQLLLFHEAALSIFCYITGSSQYFADVLVRQPECFEIIAHPGTRGGTKTAARFYRELSTLVDACHREELKRDVMRRWKAREMLRIGVRDLMGLAELPAIIREFSNLADACTQKALDIAVRSLGFTVPLPFAIIGMGKLGGQELNYSSDIDLVFVHGDDLPAEMTNVQGRTLETGILMRRLSETVIKLLAEETSQGHLFRVDMRLRPEGRFGPLTRSLSSCRAYYESWAESWEQQALIKARFIAGDWSLGRAFLEMVTPYVYRTPVSAVFVEELRANKRRIEQKCALQGETMTNVKTGLGGIRDIEFTIQKLQLTHGGLLPRLRTQGTLIALNRLRQANLLSIQEAATCASDYAFLRHLEHRLQLLNNFQTQTLPSPDHHAERMSLARRMGFSTREQFEEELLQRRERVHTFCQRLFYETSDAMLIEKKRTADDELKSLLDVIETSEAQKNLSVRLAAIGLRNPEKALQALLLPTRGNAFGGMPPDTPRLFAALAPQLLEEVGRSPDPDAALEGVERLALAVPNRAQLYAALNDSPVMLHRLVELSACSPPLLTLLTQHLEWSERILAEDRDESERNLEAELRSRLRKAASVEAKLQAIARFQLRTLLEIGSQDVFDEATVPQVMQALSRLAEAILQNLLEMCREEIVHNASDPSFASKALATVAFIGLGKLGGEELGYASDWDMLITYRAIAGDESSLREEQFALVNALASQVLARSKSLGTYGARLEIDLRLRPWGSKGALATSLQGFIRYYRKEAEVWERQAALKARFIAGNRTVGARMVHILQAASFGKRLTPEWNQAIRDMKARIEHERLKPAQRESDLKLGYGGLSDIEWLAQRLQWLHAADHPALKQPGTLPVLEALAASRQLENAEAIALQEAYLLLTQVRNAIWLYTGKAQDVLPENASARRTIALRLGFVDDTVQSAEVRLEHELQIRMQDVRRIFQRKFLSNPNVC